jgi:hypothetical protein
MKQVLIVAIGLVLVVSGLALAGNNPNVKVGVHVLPHDPERGCYLNFPVVDDPSDIVFTYGGCGQEVDFFPIFFDLTECRAVEYAVVWPGSQTCTFTVCSYSHIGQLINSGDWIAQCWQSCKTGYAIIPGWGEVTMDQPGYVCLAEVEQSGRIGILDCDDAVDEPTANFCAGVCGTIGQNPCSAGITGTIGEDDQETALTTWGKIKSLFR